MSALLARLDALDAAVIEAKGATPPPLAQWPNSRGSVYAVICGEKETIATFDEIEPDFDDDDPDNDFGREVAHANAALHVAAVNIAPTLSAIARETAKRPWWTKSATVRGVEWVRCLGCGVEIPDTLDDVPHAQRHLPTSEGPCPLQPSDAALDRAEAEAAR